MCLLVKRLERGRFVWPRADRGVVSLKNSNKMIVWGLLTRRAFC